MCCGSALQQLRETAGYGVASISRLLKIICLFCRISSLLKVSFAKEACNFKEPTNRSHPMWIVVANCCNDLLQHTAATHYCNTLLQHSTATHCCTTLLQHTAATHCCNKLLHTTKTPAPPWQRGDQNRAKSARLERLVVCAN